MRTHATQGLVNHRLTEGDMVATAHIARSNPEPGNPQTVITLPHTSAYLISRIICLTRAFTMARRVF
jgi:hypothetical protein